jgi:hypothetical protein
MGRICNSWGGGKKIWGILVGNLSEGSDFKDREECGKMELK